MLQVMGMRVYVEDTVLSESSITCSEDFERIRASLVVFNRQSKFHLIPLMRIVQLLSVKQLWTSNIVMYIVQL